MLKIEIEKWKDDVKGSKAENLDIDIDITFVGLPGTGKTHSLKYKVLKDLLKNQGYRFDDIGAFTFTNSMADDFKQSVSELDEVNESRDDWIRNLHGACMKLIYQNRAGFDVANSKVKKKFCKENNYQFSIEADKSKGDSEEAELGNNLMDHIAYARNNLLDPVEDFREVGSHSHVNEVIDRRAVKDFWKDYQDFKEENNYIDYIDMLEICLNEELIPPINVLIEDEFQDKSYLEMKLFELWNQYAGKCYVAGDPYQSIYSFKGCSPVYMKKAALEADKLEILDKTYRFGEDLWNVATGILESQGYRVPDIECADSTEVEFINFGTFKRLISDYRQEEVFHLVRGAFMYDKIDDLLFDKGIFKRKSFDSGSVAYQTYYNAVLEASEIAENVEGSWRSLDDEELSINELKKLVGMSPYDSLKKDKKSLIKALEANKKVGVNPDITDVFHRDEFIKIFTSNDPFKFLNSSYKSDWERYKPRFSEAYRSDRELTDYITHDISTIHRSKGREADYVFLYNASTKTIKRSGNPSEEARVFFVGATRAKKKLYVVDCDTPNKFNIGRGGVF